MAQELPENATFRDLTGTGAKRVEYIRRVLANFISLGEHRNGTTVRMGIAGKGLTPHYKFEALVPYTVYAADGTKTGSGEVQETFLIYNGANHKRMTAFEAESIRDEHWSSVQMSFDDVQAALGDARNELRAR